MAKIFEFPGLGLRDWRELEPAFEKVLQQAQAPPEMRAEVIAAMKIHVQKLARKYEGSMDLQLPARLDPDEIAAVQAAVHEAVSNVASWFHEVTSEMLGEIFRLETELCIARRAESPDEAN
jgi:hypothetical protein